MSQGDVVSANPNYSFTVGGNTNLYARFAPVISETKSVSSHPVSYDENYEWASCTNVNQCYKDSSSSPSGYATIGLTTGEGAVTSVYFNFDLNIPIGSTINSVSASYNCYISTTNSSYISKRTIQLYSGDTPKGTEHNVSNTTTLTNLTVGTWTAEELNNAKIRIYAVRGSSNTGTSYYFRFYGATISVNYTFEGANFVIDSRSSVGGTTISPSTQTITAPINGNRSISSSATVVISSANMTGKKLTDNLVDVTSLVSVQATRDTSQMLPNHWSTRASGDTGYTGYIFTASNMTNAYTDSNSSTYGTLKLTASSNGTRTSVGWLGVNLSDLDSIPNNATVNSITAYIKYYVSSTSYVTAVSIQLFSENTSKGSALTTRPRSATRYQFSTPGTWTLEELKDLRIGVSATHSKSKSDAWLYICGADIVVNYTTPSQYTISGLNGDHTLILSAS